MSELYRPNNELTRIAAVDESKSGITGHTYLAAISSMRSNNVRLRQLSRSEYEVRESLMHPSEYGFVIAGRVFPPTLEKRTYYRVWAQNVADLLIDLQNQLKAHDEPPIILAYIDGGRHKGDQGLEDKLDFSVEFAPKLKDRYDKELDPFARDLLWVSDAVASMFRKDGDLVHNSPADAEFENLVIGMYGIKQFLDAELNPLVK